MRRLRGFTLIEVTLATVVGIILIAGVTALYNQAKQQAGNSRAKERVFGLQATVETIMARSGGGLPSAATLYAVWATDRPNDCNQSPFGGPGGNNGTAPFHVAGFDAWDPSGPGVFSGGGPTAGPGFLQYNTFPGATASAFDQAVQQQVGARNYFVSAIDNTGTWYFFVTGGS